MVRVIKLFEAGQMDATTAMKMLSATTPPSTIPPPVGTVRNNAALALHSSPSEVAPTELESEATEDPKVPKDDKDDGDGKVT